MARLPRLSLAGGLHLLTQRGHNKQCIFADEQDYAHMLELIQTQCQNQALALYAYVLMPQYLQLLLRPDDTDALPQLMQGLGRGYARYFNQRYARSGSLWDGRYRSAVLQEERYGLPAMFFLDNAPVAAGLANSALDYAWSSHAHWVGARRSPWLSIAPSYWDLGNTPFAREIAYRDRMQQGLSNAQQQALQQASNSNWALGDSAFVHNLEKTLGRRVQAAKPGRPRLNPPQTKE